MFFRRYIQIISSNLNSKIFIIFVVIVTNLYANDNKSTDDSDWRYFPLCQQKANKLCCGYYLEPKYPLEITSNQPANTLIINADHTKLISKGLSNFDGSVVIAKNNQKLTADHAAVKQNSDETIEYFTATGRVKLTEPGLRCIGTIAEVFPKKNYKVIYDANYRIYARHATGQADKIEIFENNTLCMPNASYTTCKPGNNNWRLSAKNIKLNKVSGRGEAWHAKMYVKDVPIFYWPYVNFPIDHRRQSGFLIPNISSSSKHGASVGLPWYWNIAENYDYTISPFYLSKRGYKLDNQFRYLTPNSFGIFRFNFLPLDRKNNSFVKEKIINPEQIATNDVRYRRLQDRSERYALWFSNATKVATNWKLYINYNKVSDDNYLQDFGQDIGQSSLSSVNKVATSGADHDLGLSGGSGIEEAMLSSELHLEQSAKLEHINKYGTLKFRALQYQTLYPFDGSVATEQYKKMPEILWSSNYSYLPSKYRSRYNISYVDFKLRAIDNVATNTTGKRMHFRPSLERPIYKSYGYLKPRLQLDVLSYQQLKLSQYDLKIKHSNNPSRVIPMIDIDSGLNFSKDLNNHWRQTLEPKIYYLYVPKTDQNRYPVFDSAAIDFSYNQLFRDNRYSSVDRLSDANQMTFGIKTGLQPDASGEEKASLAIARTRYFRGLTSYLGENLEFGRWSPIAMLLNYNFNKRFSLEANIVRQKWNQTRSSTFNGKYNLDDDKIINLGYQYMRFAAVPQHQGQTSIVWAVKDDINVLGKFDYDLSQKRASYSLAGIEFQGCCTIVRLAWARSLFAAENLSQKRYDNKFLAQIVFKGFTDMGNLENNYLSGKISGYKPQDKF